MIWNGRRIEVRALSHLDRCRFCAPQRLLAKKLGFTTATCRRFYNEYTVLRVDRAEPSKNIVRGFHAFGRFLEAHPEFVGRVNFVAILVPSRMDVLEYQNYLDDVSSIAGRINARYANVETGWQPINLIMGENYPRALAAMKWYDVLMVNSIIDGMNLVAKEGCLLNERNGVLILSEGAGAADQLGDDALMVAPADVEAPPMRIYQALTMPLRRAPAPADNLRRAVESDDVAKWFREQLWDLDATRSGRARPLCLPSGGRRDRGQRLHDRRIVRPPKTRQGRTERASVSANSIGARNQRRSGRRFSAVAKILA